ncbi:7049_t:CDS:10 [Diversispora eburnea]|uniref:7049_t:CDS:1 n=2 Tax=Diversisporales TaxID=214509 RepID=A0A9N8V0F5_9GLOM|nr:7049_t:CDS:10 [Diversispora eburnea]
MDFSNEKIRLQTDAFYSKVPGQLVITTKRLYWVARGEQEPKVIVPHSPTNKLFIGKRNNPSADPKFRINTSPDQGHLFIVDNWNLLPKIQSELTSCIAGEKSAAASPSSQRSAAPSPGSGSSSPAVRHGSVPPNGKNIPIRKIPNSRTLELRRELLVRDKNLADRHKTLVFMEKCISEEEFWDQRRNLLRDQLAQMSQKKGRSSTMPTLRPVTEESGDSTVNIPKYLISEIFDEYPRVKSAFNEYVTKQKMLTEEEFWKRYVQSKFNERNRGNVSMAIKDEIFDKSWTETEEDLNKEDPASKRLKISLMHDLNATQEDHLGVEIEKDITMRPGGQSKIISIIRHNNRHGMRILESASREKSKWNKKEMLSKFDEILIEDLKPQPLEEKLKLDIKDVREYFAAQKLDSGSEVEMEDAQERFDEIFEEFKNEFSNWKPDLSNLIDPNVSFMVTKQCNEMIQNKQRNAQKSPPSLDTFPIRIHEKLKALHMAGNEFLKHYYSSLNSATRDKADKQKKLIEKLKAILKQIDNFHMLCQNEEASSDNSQTVSEETWKESLRVAQDMLKPLRISINKVLGIPPESETKQNITPRGPPTKINPNAQQRISRQTSSTNNIDASRSRNVRDNRDNRNSNRSTSSTRVSLNPNRPTRIVLKSKVDPKPLSSTRKSGNETLEHPKTDSSNKRKRMS